MIADLLRIIGLWRTRVVWLSAGVLVSLLALLSGVGLMAFAGAALASLALFAPLILRGLGVVRVLLRYAERMTTHTAMFRALAGLRVWLFRRLAANSAGGLGFRQAGDVLARLVNDVEALDGVYLRVLVPLAGAVFLLPVALVHRAQWHEWRGVWLAPVIGLLFVLAAFVLPWIAARSAMDAGTSLTASMGQLRITVLDIMTGWREVRAFGAEGRMLAAVQAREAALLGAQHTLATRTALAGAGTLLCVQAALFAVLCAAGSGSGAARSSRPSWCWPRSRSSEGSPEPGPIWATPPRRHIACWKPRMRRYRCRIRPVPAPNRPRVAAAVRRRAFPLAAGIAGGVRRADHGYRAWRAGLRSRSLGLRQVDLGGVGA